MVTDTDAVSTLKQELAAHGGEAVLVVTREYRFYGCGGMGYEPVLKDYQLRTDFELGIISPPFLGHDGHTSVIYVDSKKWIWALYLEKQWMEAGLDIAIPRIAFVTPGLEDLNRPIYAPDNGRASRQKWEEERGCRDPDYALEIIIGNKDVEEYLGARVQKHLPHGEWHKQELEKGWASIAQERNRRILPPEMLKGFLELTGIAEMRRQEAARLLQEQQAVLRQLLSLEMQLQFTRANAKWVSMRREAMLRLMAHAREIGADKIDPFVAQDLHGVEIRLRPADFCSK